MGSGELGNLFGRGGEGQPSLTGDGDRREQGGVEIDSGGGGQFGETAGHRPDRIPLMNGQLNLGSGPQERRRGWSRGGP